MKVAIPTEDGINVTPHMGHAPTLVVFEVQSNQVVGSESRENPWADPKYHGHGEEKAKGMDPHEGLAELVKDCDIVLGYGHACGVVGALEEKGLKVFMLNAPCTAQQAIDAFVKYAASNAI